MSEEQISDRTFWDAYAKGQSAVIPFMEGFANRAMSEASLAPGSRVLDIATGTGAMAVVAAKAGMAVLATDFSPGMVSTVASYGIANIEARVMDGQALDLADASFDAAFSMFGVVLFADWRAGLSEMARVVRTGGVGSVGVWKAPGGAAATLLCSQLCGELFRHLELPVVADGQVEMRDPDRLRAVLISAGFSEVRVVEETNDFFVDAASMDDPDRLFTFNPLWPQLDAEQRARIISTIDASLRRTPGRPLAVPTTALIATAIRHLRFATSQEPSSF